MVRFNDLCRWTVGEVLSALDRSGVDISLPYSGSVGAPLDSLACSTNPDGSAIFKHVTMDSLITRGDARMRTVEIELVFHPDGDLTLLARSVTDTIALTRQTVLSTRYDNLTWWELAKVCRAAVRLWEAGP